MKIYESQKRHEIRYPNGFVYKQPYTRVIDLRGTGMEAYQFCISAEYRVGDIVVESDEYCLVQEGRILGEPIRQEWRGTTGTLAFFTKIFAEVRDYLASLERIAAGDSMIF